MMVTHNELSEISEDLIEWAGYRLCFAHQSECAMFKIFGLAGAVLVFVAVHALTADNLVAALAGLCFLALEW